MVQAIAAEVKGLLRKEKGLTTKTNYNLFLLTISASKETGATLAFDNWPREKLVDLSPPHILKLKFINGDKVLFVWRARCIQIGERIDRGASKGSGQRKLGS